MLSLCFIPSPRKIKNEIPTLVPTRYSEKLNVLLNRHCGENDPCPSHFPLKQDMVGIIPATKYGRLCLRLGTSSEEDRSHTQSRPLKYWIPILRTRSFLSSSVSRVPPRRRLAAKRRISMYLNRQHRSIACHQPFVNT